MTNITCLQMQWHFLSLKPQFDHLSLLFLDLCADGGV